jgi:hypothetical protein
MGKKVADVFYGIERHSLAPKLARDSKIGDTSARIGLLEKAGFAASDANAVAQGPAGTRERV